MRYRPRTGSGIRRNGLAPAAAGVPGNGHCNSRIVRPDALNSKGKLVSDATSIRRLVIDWLDDNYHFGEAESLLVDDERSFLQNGILDSLGFVRLTLHLEQTFGIMIDRKHLTPDNFDSMGKIVRYVEARLPATR